MSTLSKKDEVLLHVLKNYDAENTAGITNRRTVALAPEQVAAVSAIGTKLGVPANKAVAVLVRYWETAEK